MGIACLTQAGAARAEDRIGKTEIAKNVVQRVVTTASSAIQPGDDVFANENVRTGVESAAKFVFSDSTNLAIGPTSTVKLDRFVYNSDVSYAKAAVRFTAGAFRFTTGASEKKAYQLKTDTATIGVRGTIFDVSVSRGVTIVTLVEGEIAVCPRSKFDGDPRTLSKAQLAKFQCQDLTQPGQTAKVTSRSAALSPVPFSFASNFCSDGGGLCSASTSTAAATPAGALMCYMKHDN